MEQYLFGDNHAIFNSWEEQGNIYLIDIGHSYARSVTNDAAYVVQNLRLKYGPFNNKRIFYKDSSNRWDEIVVTPDEIFEGFLPCPASWIPPREDAKTLKGD